MKVNLGGVIPLSVNEWKDHVSLVVFFNGCPFRCSYCHNYKMIDAINIVDVDIIKTEILNSTPFINSVVFTGGEPTMQPEPIEELLKFSKSLGLSTMVETNGYYPSVLKHLFELNLIDMIFVDIKTTHADYDNLTKAPNSYENVIETLRVGIPHTKRTTIFKNIKIPRCSLVYQKGLVKLSPDKSMKEYTEKEFERFINK
jgi:anaerobic ribonucleoside-triphosphate reductase activating protein